MRCDQQVPTLKTKVEGILVRLVTMQLSRDVTSRRGAVTSQRPAQNPIGASHLRAPPNPLRALPKREMIWPERACLQYPPGRADAHTRNLGVRRTRWVVRGILHAHFDEVLFSPRMFHAYDNAPDRSLVTLMRVTSKHMLCVDGQLFRPSSTSPLY